MAIMKNFCSIDSDVAFGMMNGREHLGSNGPNRSSKVDPWISVYCTNPVPNRLFLKGTFRLSHPEVGQTQTYLLSLLSQIRRRVV